MKKETPLPPSHLYGPYRSSVMKDLEKPVYPKSIKKLTRELVKRLLAQKDKFRVVEKESASPWMGLIDNEDFTFRLYSGTDWWWFSLHVHLAGSTHSFRVGFWQGRALWAAEQRTFARQADQEDRSVQFLTKVIEGLPTIPKRDFPDIPRSF